MGYTFRLAARNDIGTRYGVSFSPSLSNVRAWLWQSLTLLEGVRMLPLHGAPLRANPEVREGL